MSFCQKMVLSRYKVCGYIQHIVQQQHLLFGFHSSDSSSIPSETVERLLKLLMQSTFSSAWSQLCASMPPMHHAFFNAIYICHSLSYTTPCRFQNTIQDHKTKYIPYPKWQCVSILLAYEVYTHIMSIFSMYLLFSQIDFLLIRYFYIHFLFHG